MCCGLDCHSILPSSVTCRESEGACDVAENCTGASPNCPADTFLNTSYICNPSLGVCQANVTCTGESPLCPTWDNYYPFLYICHTSQGVCDTELFCTGDSPACPAPQYSTALCRQASNECDLPEYCSVRASRVLQMPLLVRVSRVVSMVLCVNEITVLALRQHAYH